VDEKCQFSDSIDKIALHEENCPEKLVSCFFRKNGCTELVKKKNQKKHEDTCIFQEISCTDCGIKMTLKELEVHSLFCSQKNKCPKCHLPITSHTHDCINDLLKEVIRLRESRAILEYENTQLKLKQKTLEELLKSNVQKEEEKSSKH